MNLSEQDIKAREALHRRQGIGARYDSPGSPAEDLLLVRRGTAYFARRLNELSDQELGRTSSFKDWNRRKLVAFIGYHARQMAMRIERISASEQSLDSSTKMNIESQLKLGVTLPPHALRSLFHHSAIHLDVVWRDLPSEDWDSSIFTDQEGEIRIRKTPRIRAQEIWLAAVNLNNRGGIKDVPPQYQPPSQS